MKKPNKKKLIEYAFEELGAEDMLEYEKKVQRGDEIDKECTAYRQMREDLKLLKNVPECQLSADRVRDVILRSEILGQKFIRKSWFFLTPFVVALAFGIFLLTPKKLSDDFNVEVLNEHIAREMSLKKNEYRTVAVESPVKESLVAGPAAEPPLNKRNLENKKERSLSRLLIKAQDSPINAIAKQKKKDLKKESNGLNEVAKPTPSSNKSFIKNVVIIREEASTDLGGYYADEAAADHLLVIRG